MNQAADKTTSPAYGGTLASGAVHLWTYYVHWLTIIVADQFGNLLAPFYEGAHVSEGQNDLEINQQMSGFGTYQGPVGRTYDRPGQANFPADSTTAMAWPAPPPHLPLQDSMATQNLHVQIGGHDLVPAFAISNRQVITTAATGNVQIIWNQ